MSKRINKGGVLLGGLLLTIGLACGPAMAFDFETAEGIFCDSSEQAERYVSLYSGDSVAAVAGVNSEVNDAKACGFMKVAFLPGETMPTLRNRENAFDISRVLVIGVLTPQGLRNVRPFVQFRLDKLAEWMA